MVLLRRPYLRAVMAVIWMMLSDDYSLAGFLTGFIMATVALAIFPAPIKPLHPLKFSGVGQAVAWLGKAVGLTLYFLWQVVLANLQVTKLVFSPKSALKPGIIAMPIKLTSPGQIALLSAMITLTPGTIVVDVSEDWERIYIHAIDASDEAEALRVPRRFEEMILEVIP